MDKKQKIIIIILVCLIGGVAIYLVTKNQGTPIVKTKEVFNVTGCDTNESKNCWYRFTKDEADAVCKQFEAEVATKEQLTSAFNNGAQWCVAGWLKDGTLGYPTQVTYDDGDTKHNLWCGTKGTQNWSPPNDSYKSGVTCYGIKPDQSNSIKPVTGISDVKFLNVNEFYRKHTDNKDVGPAKWNAPNMTIPNMTTPTATSPYSTTTTPAKITSAPTTTPYSTTTTPAKITSAPTTTPYSTTTTPAKITSAPTTTPYSTTTTPAKITSAPTTTPVKIAKSYGESCKDVNTYCPSDSFCDTDNICKQICKLDSTSRTNGKCDVAKMVAGEFSCATKDCPHSFKDEVTGATRPCSCSNVKDNKASPDSYCNPTDGSCIIQ